MSEFVPEGWTLLEVQKAFKLGRGRVISKPEIRDNPGHYPVFSSQSKDNGKMGSINTYDFDGEYITWTTDGAYAGTVFHRKGQFNCTNVCGTLQDNGNYDVFPNFVARYLSTVAKSHVSYVGNPKLMNGTFGEIEFLLPPFPEQQKIAAILTSVDEVIEKTQAQINKLKDLKKGMMQELLTRGVGVDGKPHTEFKDSPVGRIPKGWDCVQMDTICEKITDGEHQTPIRTNDGYYLLSARNVRDGYIDLTNVDYVGEAEFQRISKRISPKQGDVLISCSGSVGRVAVVPPGLEFSMVRSVAILQLKSECVDSEFMALQVSATAIQYQIEQSLSQQAQANLFQGAIKKLIVVVPSLLEQQQIANIVNSMTVKIITQQNKLKATKSLKKALMQDLLTGKVRVKVDTE
ncbi:hypothetical protein GNP84_18570 [Aliivibrio fischeri]|uniref:restriction endonuclease subunit S n=1 Tax=Aliivibrio fischeri TaxID=668 RepID=UPI0012D98402|nr:restriction endonuclease subunit S [Aliivibrio fischeri]MUK78890.1 hypothetical protein [Aliivibrio fischeri]